MSQTRATKFLDLIRRSERGRLKVYLGYGPGVGKTYMMLEEAHRLKAEGLDVIIGLVETHGRSETAELIAGIEVLPRKRNEYHGITIEEFDVDACLARKPQVAIVDELAHSNVPGGRNAKRYEDVQELLAAGIHIITALNVQHLESLYNTVEHLVGVKVRERIPDTVLAEADQVVNIDLAPEDLQKRLCEGKIYPKDRVESSLANYFQSGNLEHLRELALRELASQIDSRRRERPDRSATGTDQIMVCLSSRGPNSARLLRFGSRLAGRLNRNWYAVYVQTPSEDPTRIDARTQRLLADTLTLANQLGATVFTFKGQDVADTIMRFAREYRVGQVVIGKPHAVPLWRRLIGHRSVAERLIFMAADTSIIVVDADADEPGKELPAAPSSDSSVTTPAGTPFGELRPKPNVVSLLDDERVLVWNDPITKNQALMQLVRSIAGKDNVIDVQAVLSGLWKREAQGSTFLNEGVALPHARIDGLKEPIVALGIAHAGILDARTEKPVEAIFLLLTPSENAAAHLQLLASAGRLLQRKELRTALRAVETPTEAMIALQTHARTRLLS